MLLKYKKIIKEVESTSSYSRLGVKIDSIDQNIYLENIGLNSFIVFSGESQQQAYAVQNKNRIYVWLGGAQFNFDITQKDFEVSENIGIDVESERIYPPMPGMIVKVMKSVGDCVEEGDPILIIEAMKMETTLYSSIKGVIKKISAEPGMQADTDFELALIEKI